MRERLSDGGATRVEPRGRERSQARQQLVEVLKRIALRGRPPRSGLSGEGLEDHLSAGANVPLEVRGASPERDAEHCHQEPQQRGRGHSRQKRLGERQQRRAHEQHGGQLEGDDEHPTGGGGEVDSLALFRRKGEPRQGHAKLLAHPDHAEAKRRAQGERRPDDEQPRNQLGHAEVIAREGDDLPNRGRGRDHDARNQRRIEDQQAEEWADTRQRSIRGPARAQLLQPASVERRERLERPRELAVHPGGDRVRRPDHPGREQGGHG